MTLKELREIAFQFQKEQNWAQFHSPKNLAISLCCESTEVLEHFLWTLDDTLSDEKRMQISDELGDVLLNLLMFSQVLDIDLEESFLKKLEKTKKKYPVPVSDKDVFSKV